MASTRKNTKATISKQQRIDVVADKVALVETSSLRLSLDEGVERGHNRGEKSKSRLYQTIRTILVLIIPMIYLLFQPNKQKDSIYTCYTGVSNTNIERDQEVCVTTKKSKVYIGKCMVVPTRHDLGNKR